MNDEINKQKVALKCGEDILALLDLTTEERVFAESMGETLARLTVQSYATALSSRMDEFQAAGKPPLRPLCITAILAYALKASVDPAR
jgi:hypothetical protein